MEFLKPTDSDEQGLDDLQVGECEYECEQCEIRDGCCVWEREKKLAELK